MTSLRIRAVQALFFLILSLLCAEGAFAKDSPQREFARQFASPRLQFLDQGPENPRPQIGRFPVWLRWLLVDLLGQAPEIPPDRFRPECSISALETALRQEPRAAKQGEILRQRWGACEQDYASGVKSDTANVIQIMRLDMKVSEHPFISRVRLNLPGGSPKAWLALKGDLKPRPFVIVRLGVFANMEEFIPERFFLIQLFEQGFANLLILENITSADYLLAHPGIGWGASIEAWQNLRLAQMLKDPAEPISKLVSSVHLTGISLGGHGVLGAAALNDWNPRPGGGRWIEGASAFCPVVRLKDTLLFNTQPGPRGVAIDWWIYKRLAPLRLQTPELEGPFAWWSAPSFFKKSLDWAEQNFRPAPGLYQNVKSPLGESRVPGFWQTSDLESWVEKLKTPLVVFATRRDLLVPLEMNTSRLQKTWSQGQAEASAVEFAEGFHCTLPAAYDWGALSAMLNGVTLAQVGPWREQMERFELDVEEVVPSDLLQDGFDWSFRLKWPEEGPSVSVAFEVVNRRTKKSSTFSVNLHRNAFDFYFLNPQLGPEEKQMLERWLTHRLKLDFVSLQGRMHAVLSWPKAPDSKAPTPVAGTL